MASPFGEDEAKSSSIKVVVLEVVRMTNIEAAKNNFWGMPGYDSEWTVYSWCYFSEPDVLYWMPLPEPPKEVERDGRNESV